MARFASVVDFLVDKQRSVEGDSKAAIARYRLTGSFGFTSSILNCNRMFWRPFICRHRLPCRPTLSKTSAFDTTMQLCWASAYRWWLTLNELMTADKGAIRTTRIDLVQEMTPEVHQFQEDKSEELCFQRTNRLTNWKWYGSTLVH